tara:strand:- start:1624 stop:3261 length:1638 start_codon:yes stop_codon:yes gene_type:complete
MAGNANIFLGSGASLTLVPELDIYFPIHSGSGTGLSTATGIKADTAYTNVYHWVPKMYVGCTVDIYNTGGTLLSTHLITDNTEHTLVLGTAAATFASGNYGIIRGYGAPCPGARNSLTARLNADNWLGILESATFPQVEQEMKQLNLQLGGTRSITHQYRGIRTASGGNLGFIMHTGAMLYYALGKCTQVKANLSAATIGGSGYSAASAGKVYINTNANGSPSATGTGALTTITNFSETGPIFYKTDYNGTNLTPNVNLRIDAVNDLQLVDRTTVDASTLLVVDPIEYTFNEQNTSELPSFSLEQSIAKDPATLTTDSTGKTNAESQNFVRVARGNRINTLTITASEGEEMKMTADLNTRAVESIRNLGAATNYESRAGVEDNTQLFNWDQNGGTTMFSPFFFSAGTFTILGEQFMKMNSMTLTINNNLIDKRYMGGHRDMKEGLAGQRTYELSFTAVVTDDALFQEIFNEAENTGTTTGTGLIQLAFTKDNGESVTIKLKDYFIDTANWTIPDDKGPVTVEATVKPRNLLTDGCVVNTSYILQG